MKRKTFFNLASILIFFPTIISLVVGADSGNVSAKAILLVSLIVAYGGAWLLTVLKYDRHKVRDATGRIGAALEESVSNETSRVNKVNKFLKAAIPVLLVLALLKVLLT